MYSICWGQNGTGCRGDIFIPPGISHEAAVFETSLQEPIPAMLWIHPEFMKNIQQFFSLPHYRSSSFKAPGQWVGVSGKVFPICLQGSGTRQEGFEACISSITVQLLIHRPGRTHSKAMEPLTEKKELLDELIRYIEDHLAEKITLKSAAANFYISERAVSRLFSEKMDVSFYRYVTQRRLIAAKTRIINGESLETIGEQVGFTDYYTFYRAFKQAFSISPQQFKKLQKV